MLRPNFHWIWIMIEKTIKSNGPLLREWNQLHFESKSKVSGFYPRPVLAFGYCRCLRPTVCMWGSCVTVHVSIKELCDFFCVTSYSTVHQLFLYVTMFRYNCVTVNFFFPFFLHVQMSTHVQVLWVWTCIQRDHCTVAPSLVHVLAPQPWISMSLWWSPGHYWHTASM